jgi:hypothetical protein
MKRIVSAWALYFRRRAAIRAYRQCTERTAELFAEFNARRTELRAALAAESAAADRMEALLKSNN